MQKLKRVTSFKSVNSFFIEIIIVIFFFTISSAVIIQIFACAYQRNNQTDTLNTSILKTQTVCESFSSSGDINSALRGLFGESADTYLSDKSISIPINDKWEVTPNGNFIFTVSLSQKPCPAGNMIMAKFTVIENSKILYEATSSIYNPLKGGV